MSSTTASLTEVIEEDFLQCGICLEPYKTPKTLACLHTFCESCLTDYHAKCANKKVATCPTCREETHLEGAEIHSLKDNFLLKNLQNVMTSHGRVLACDNCDADGSRQTAVVRCHDCEQALCAQCYRAHSRMKMTKGHKVEALAGGDQAAADDTSQLKSSPGLPQAEEDRLDSISFSKLQAYRCDVHDEQVKLFCIKCEMPICLICYATEHTSHNCLNWKDAVEQECEKVRGILGEIDEKTGKVKCLLEVTEESLRSIEKKMSDTVTHIGNKRVALYSLIDHHANGQINKVREMMKGEMKQLDMKRSEIKDAIEVSDQDICTAENVLKQGSDGEKVSLKKKLRGRLEALRMLETTHDGQDGDPISITFQPGILTEGTIESLFGRLLMAKVKPAGDVTVAKDKETVFVKPVEVEMSKYQAMSSMATPVRIEPPTPPPKPQSKVALIVIETKTPSDQFSCLISGLTIMTNDNIAIVDRNNCSLKMFAHEGYLLKEMRKSNQLISPSDVKATADDRLIVADAGKIKIANLGSLSCDIVVDCQVQVVDGLVINQKIGIAYVTDVSRNCLFVCDIRARRVTRALNEHQLLTRGCVHLALNNKGHVIIAFPSSGIVKVFSMQEQVKVLATYAPARFSPAGLCTDRDNNIIVTNPQSNEVIVLSPQAKFLSTLLSGEHGLESPCVVAIDSRDRLVVGEQSSGRVKIFPYDKPSA